MVNNTHECKVIVVTYINPATRETYISHGFCEICLKDIVLPQIPLREYLTTEGKK
jgi:hypothetical protein